MIGKQTSGRSFGGCVRYLLQRELACILDADGVRAHDMALIIHDFNIQRKMNPSLGKAVGHLILSWSKDDLDKLTPAKLTEHAREYMQKMKIADTQYIVVLHADREHPHIHIVYNRVNNFGKTISDSNNYKHNVQVCKEMTLKHGYHFGEGKKGVNRERLKGKEQIRYFLFDAINVAKKNVNSWERLQTLLAQKGIGMEFKYKSGSKEIQGVSFSLGDIKMKGSAIDRRCSFKNLNEFLQNNTLANQIRTAVQARTQDIPTSNDMVGTTHAENTNSIQQGSEWLDLFGELGYAFGGTGDEDDAKKRRKHGIGR
ncbi:MAG: relaxase/mobilization nuclease domain-containing protein [Bacteroidetes bacterium]|nr:relaxase/mobilization nuclease domain-containing protein [Bacteroidota bacterium]